MEIMSNVLKKCFDIFQQEVFSLEGIPNTYKIQAAYFQKENPSMPCFGCSMRDSLFLITNYLKKNTTKSITDNNVVEYFLLQNLLVDRMETMLDILKIDDQLRQKEFKVFQEINEWTYFFKLNLREKNAEPKQISHISTSFSQLNMIDLTTRFCTAINNFIALFYAFLVKKYTSNDSKLLSQSVVTT